MNWRLSRLFFYDRLENSGLVAVSTGYHFNCAIKSNGYFKCWGMNDTAYKEHVDTVQDEILT